jgi:hypothetical protein
VPPGRLDTPLCPLGGGLAAPRVAPTDARLRWAWAALIYRSRVRMGLFAEVRKEGKMLIFLVVGGTGIEPVTPAV